MWFMMQSWQAGSIMPGLLLLPLTPILSPAGFLVLRKDLWKDLRPSGYTTMSKSFERDFDGQVAV